MHAFEQIKIYTDSFFMKSFVIDSWFTYPVFSLSFQKNSEKVSEDFITYDFFDKSVIEFSSF